MADPGDTTNPFAAASPWDDLPDDFFLSASISPPPAPIPSTSPRRPAASTPHRSASLPPASTPAPTPSASASASDPRPRAARQQQPHLHPSHSLPVFPGTSAEVWPPPPGPHHAGSLPEFAAAPALPAHRPPARAAVRDDRPPPLELRPRPSRESQAGAALRALACYADGEGAPRLWAAGEAGVRAWDLVDAFRPPASRQRWGDEAAAPFRESRRTAPALCLATDPARGVVWSGHADGRIMGWNAVPGPEAGDCLAWEAHRGPVFALAVSPYGNSPWLRLDTIQCSFT